MASRKKHRSNKNIFHKGIKYIKNKSSKIAPSVKHGLENIGKSVTTTAKKTIPVGKGSIKQIYGLFGFKNKTKKGSRRRATKSRKN